MPPDPPSLPMRSAAPTLTHRVSNRPGFVGIIPIFLENPESPRKLDRDGKSPDLN